MINEEIMFTCETHVNEDTSNIIKYIQHELKNEIQNIVLNDGQLRIFDILVNETKGLHVLEGILGSGKTFFMKYLTHYLQTQGKNVLLTTTTIGTTTLWLSQHACTIYTQFRIHVCGYLSVLPQPSNILQSLKFANVIIIDEILMMISTMLCAIEQQLKQAQDNMNPFANLLLLLVGDLAQLCPICKHF